MRRMLPDHQGWGLVICAFIWALVGRALFYGLPTVHHPNAFHELVPPQWRGVCWLLSAGVGLGAAWIRPARPVAIGVLIFMPALRSSSYLFAWAVSWWPWAHSPGYPDGWYSASYFLAMVLLVVYIAFEKRNGPSHELYAALRAVEDHDR